VTFENLQRLKAIEQQRSRLSQVESLRRFAGEIAHEFNNALTVVSGNLALLEQLPVPADGRRLLDSSLKACARASDTIKRLTQQPPRASLRVQTLDPDEAVRRACARAGRSRAVPPKIALAENLWALCADAVLLE